MPHFGRIIQKYWTQNSLTKKNTVALNINSQQVTNFHINKYEQQFCTLSFSQNL